MSPRKLHIRAELEAYVIRTTACSTIVSVSSVYKVTGSFLVYNMKTP